MNNKLQEMRDNLEKSFKASAGAFYARIRCAENWQFSDCYTADLVLAAFYAGKCEQTARILWKEFGDKSFLEEARDMIARVEEEVWGNG